MGIIKVSEDLRIKQDDHDVIIEKGDLIRIIPEDEDFYGRGGDLKHARGMGGAMLYHGTSAKLLKNILKFGLLPQTDVYNKNYKKYTGSSENPEYVSVTTDRNRAGMFARITTRSLGGNPIVLFINNQYPLYIDPEGGGSMPLYLYKGLIKPNEIRSYYDESGIRHKLH